MPVKTPKDRVLKLRELIHLFHDNIRQYKTSSYDEANTRVDFIDKFFELLEWDVRNTKGYSEAYREVVREDKVIIAGKPKAPDYSFRIGGRKFFFVEAKKPCVNIKEDRDPAYQLRRYGYTAKLPLSILTDFEEFAVYDTRIKPSITDKASTARIFYCEFIDLLKQNKIDPEITNFEYIYAIFSKDAILKGSFDRYIEETKKKKGTSEVDKEILKLIDDWRCELAKNIALRNTELDVYNLNYAVQKIIDRIIFLRIAEDRNTEEYGKLKSLLETKEIYKQLVQVFDEANKKYNSGLFAPQEYIDTLQIDNNILTRIIKSFYYPACPYELSILPIEILGNAYEQFLGKKIRLTTAHQAKIEEKPEVRKAGGVYYTPQYIVDYIVQNTVGEKVKRKRPEDIEHLRIVDPACGSGSFLVRAYDFLLRHYIKYYCQKSKLQTALKKGKIYQVDETTYYLSIDEKQKILLNNIYGVDIDEQAVEVTKLSLLLKLMENEGEEYKNFLFQHHDLTLLPDLSDNIKCGNSLIGSDFYDDKDLGLFDKDEMRKVNVFDWEKEFPKVFENGGFDCVIGNPPYLRIQGLQEHYGQQIEYFIDNYLSAIKRFDLYLLFLEKGFKILEEDGILSFICPHKFINSDFGSGIREFLLKYEALKKIISFGNNLIFEQATTYTGLIFLSKSQNASFFYYEFNNTDIKMLSSKLFELHLNDFAEFTYLDIDNNPWVLTNKAVKMVLVKLNSQNNTLNDSFQNIFQGIVTGIDEIYFLKKINDNQNDIIEVYSERKNEIIRIEKDILKPILKGEDVSRYSIPIIKYYCIYPYYLENNKTKIFEEEDLIKKFPLAYKYLREFKKEIINLRIKYKTNPIYWYSCHRGRSIGFFETDKIITPEISLGCNMTLDLNKLYHNTMVYSLLPMPDQNEDIKYWLGLLNSKIMWWYLSNTGNVLRGGYFRFKTNYLKPFPVKKINFNNESEIAKHNVIVTHVEQMLKTQKQYHSAKSNADKTIHKKKIDLLDKQIDSLVYELYGLTDEEIRIVEES